MNSGYDYTNTLTGTSTTQTSVAGFYPGTVTTYNGTTSISNASSLTATNFDGTLPFSVCATVNLTVPGSSETTILSNFGATSGPGFSLRVISTGQMDLYLVNNFGGGNYIEVTSGAVVRTGFPNRICFTYDGSKTAAGVTFWSNGATSATTPAHDALTGSMASSHAMQVGAEFGVTIPTVGAIGNVRVWNRQLTLADGP